jgi:trigger factor
MAQSTAAPSSASSVRIEDVGPSRKRLTITIPGHRVTEQLDESIAAVASEAAIPGFRKGRVPRSLVEKRFGAMVRDEARNQLVASAYSEAIEQHKLQVLGEPEPTEDLSKVELKPGADLTISIEVEIVPEFQLPALEGIEVKRPAAVVTDEMVESQVRQLCQNEGTLEHQPKAEPGDFCIGDGVIRDEKSGTEYLTLAGAVIQIPAADAGPRGAILGVLVEDFAKQAGAPGEGDEVVIKVKGPENHENPEMRGKPLVITFKVQRIERIKPATIEDLVARFGVADEKQLRETITLQLNQRAVIGQQVAMREQIARHLLDSVDLDLPEKLTARQSERNIQRQRLEMMYRGLTPMNVEQRMAEIRDRGHEAAQRELKLFFILARVAEQFNVQVTNEEVIGRVSQIARERGTRPQDLYQELAKSNQLVHVAQQIREHKAIDAVLSRAKVVDGEVPGADEPAEKAEKAAPKKAAPRKKKADAEG